MVRTRRVASFAERADLDAEKEEEKQLKEQEEQNKNVIKRDFYFNEVLAIARGRIRLNVELRLMIFPYFCCRMIDPMAWLQKNKPLSPTAKTRSQSASVNSRGKRTWVIPALLTRMSIFPNSRIAVSTMR